MSEAKHTQLPWREEPNGWTPWAGAIGILPANQDEEHAIAWTTSGDNEVANAEFIVRAVNSHQAMVEALEAARERLQDDAESGAPGWKGAQRLVEQIDAALFSAAPPVESKSEVGG